MPSVTLGTKTERPRKSNKCMKNITRKKVLVHHVWGESLLLRNFDRVCLFAWMWVQWGRLEIFLIQLFWGSLENLKSCYKLKEFVFCLLFWLFSVTLKNISPLLCVQEEQYKLKEFVFCLLFWLFSDTLKNISPLLCGRNKCGLLLLFKRSKQRTRRNKNKN